LAVYCTFSKSVDRGEHSLVTRTLSHWVSKTVQPSSYFLEEISLDIKTRWKQITFCRRCVIDDYLLYMFYIYISLINRFYIYRITRWLYCYIIRYIRPSTEISSQHTQLFINGLLTLIKNGWIFKEKRAKVGIIEFKILCFDISVDIKTRLKQITLRRRCVIDDYLLYIFYIYISYIYRFYSYILTGRLYCYIIRYIRPSTKISSQHIQLFINGLFKDTCKITTIFTYIYTSI